MALSMDEQRVLAEIERRLAAEEPGLATCLTNFRRPGPAAVLRSPRARIIGSLFTVLLVAMISLMVYAMIPFRAHGVRTPARPGTIPGQAQITATGTGSSASPGSVTINSTARQAGSTGNAAARASSSSVQQGAAARGRTATRTAPSASAKAASARVGSATAGPAKTSPAKTSPAKTSPAAARTANTQTRAKTVGLPYVGSSR
jgi:hypothetical protein